MWWSIPQQMSAELYAKFEAGQDAGYTWDLGDSREGSWRPDGENTSINRYTIDFRSKQQTNIDNLLTYLTSRGIGADWYDFMYSPNTFWDVNKRLLIPFYWRGDIVGFTGRMFEKS